MLISIRYNSPLFTVFPHFVYSISPFIHNIFISVHSIFVSIHSSVPSFILPPPPSIHSITSIVHIIFTSIWSISASVPPIPTLVLSPFRDISPSRSPFCYTCCYFSIGQSITTLLKQSTIQYTLLLFMYRFFLLRSIISPTENILILTFPLYQVLNFTVAIISFLSNVFTRSRLFPLPRIYPIRTRALYHYESYPFVVFTHP